MRILLLILFNQKSTDISNAVRNAVIGTNHKLVYIDNVEPSNDIFYKEMEMADLIIADISDFKANVMFELGAAKSLKKPTLLIVQKEYLSYEKNVEELHSFAFNAHIILYEREHLFGLSYKLKDYLNESNSIIQFPLDTHTNKKSIILITDEVNEKLIDYFSKHPNELKTINNRLFEEFVSELFWGFGYQVELTQKTRDGGRDIIAIKSAETIDKYLIECKRPDIGNNIGIKPVRELFGVKQDEKATKAILATTSYFTKDAHQFFERNKWELEPKDFDGIISWIKQYKKIKNIT